MQRYWQASKLVCVVWLCCLVATSGGCGPAPASHLTVFSQDGKRYDAGAWSPDGRWLAVEGSDTSAIALFSSTGQTVKYLHLGCELGAEEFSWLPDGRLSCFRPESTELLHIVALTSSGQPGQQTTIDTPIPLDSREFIYALQWNPRHFWLAILADETPETRAPALYLSDLTGHSLMAPMSTDAEEMTWSPDGTRLALVQQNGDVTLLTIQQVGAETLSVVRTRVLAAETEYLESVAWSPSGHWLVCRHGSYDSEDYLFLLATDGSGKQVKLTSSTTEGQLASVAWSPDGKHLIGVRATDGVLLSLDIAKLLKEKGVAS